MTYFLTLKCKTYEEITDHMNNITRFGLMTKDQIQLSNVDIVDFKISESKNELFAVLKIHAND